jgi:hypothetical protein
VILAPAGREGVELELRRVTGRLAALGPARLARPVEDGPVPAARVRPVLQDLADEAARLEGRAARPVPELAPHALGDQLVVLTHDVLAASGDDEAVVDGLHDRLVALRRAL